MENGFNCDTLSTWKSGQCCEMCHTRNTPHVFRLGKTTHKICCKYAGHFIDAHSKEEVELDDTAMDSTLVTARTM